MAEHSCWEQTTGDKDLSANMPPLCRCIALGHGLRTLSEWPICCIAHHNQQPTAFFPQTSNMSVFQWMYGPV